VASITLLSIRGETCELCRPSLELQPATAKTTQPNKVILRSPSLITRALKRAAIKLNAQLQNRDFEILNSKNNPTVRSVPTKVQSTPVYRRWPVWIAYAVLFAVAIPWYWPAEETTIVVGLPLWAAVSLGTSAIISCFTAWLLIKCWPTDDQLDSDEL